MNSNKSKPINPYESSAKSDARSRGSILRIVVALPFYVVGAIYSLMFYRMPGRLYEAWSRYTSGEEAPVLGDPAFAESPWRSTVIPLMGLGLLLVAYGISTRKRTATLVGAVWAFVVFIVGSSLR